MGDPAATEGRMDGNPCHEIGMQVATQVGCDFLVNAAITHGRVLSAEFSQAKRWQRKGGPIS